MALWDRDLFLFGPRYPATSKEYLEGFLHMASSQCKYQGFEMDIYQIHQIPFWEINKPNQFAGTPIRSTGPYLQDVPHTVCQISICVWLYIWFFMFMFLCLCFYFYGFYFYISYFYLYVFVCLCSLFMFFMFLFICSCLYFYGFMVVFLFLFLCFYVIWVNLCKPSCINICPILCDFAANNGASWSQNGKWWNDQKGYKFSLGKRIQKKRKRKSVWQVISET